MESHKGKERGVSEMKEKPKVNFFAKESELRRAIEDKKASDFDSL